jgi:hypothetical protein
MYWIRKEDGNEGGTAKEFNGRKAGERGFEF